MTLILRGTKGAQVTTTEMDANLSGLADGSNWANSVTANSDITILGDLSVGGDLSVTGGTITGITDLAVADGGTGRSTGGTAYGLIAAGTTATGAHQTLAAGATTEILVGGGSSALPVWTTATGSGAPVRATSPTLVTPLLGTPTSGTLTNCSGLSISSGVSGLGAGIATFLATPSSANLASAVTGETGSGALVFATSPTLVTPALGTPSSGTLTNCTGLPVAGGGTGRATATAYAVICGGTTNTGAHQSIASVGTSGQVLTSNGASNLPTFQDLPNGALVKLTSGTVSNAATLDVVMTSYTSYRNKLFVFASFIPATNNASLYFRTSTDGGTNYAASAGNYRYAGLRIPDSGTITGNGSGGAAQIDLTFGSTVVSTDAYGMSGMVMLYDTTNTAMRPRIEARSANNNSSEGWTLTTGVGSRESAEDTDAFRILFSAGNISSGTWSLYGWN